MSRLPSISPIPSCAAWLGGLGALPFGLCALLAMRSDGALNAVGLKALLGYGAVILSFLGGIHWGLAISPGSPGKTPSCARLSVSVLPALIAWPALLLPLAIGFVLLAGAFIAMFFFDVHTSRTGLAPSWYPRLRLPLSCAAATSLIIGAYLGTP
jgi:hypothetical protein